MKRLLFLITMLLLSACSTTQIVENWKNPDIDTYEPFKVLVVGMTSNNEARQKFEQQLKNELEARGSQAVMSLDYFDASLTAENITEASLKKLEYNLIKDGFDTILFTKVIGVENKVVYKKSYTDDDNTHRKFRDEYLKYQAIYIDPGYYDEYNVFHAETSMYCICPTKERELIWKGYIDIMDPISIDETVNDYVRLAIVVLEEQQLIGPIASKDGIKN